MTIPELFRSGRLEDARALLTEKVKVKPTDSENRSLLFQVLAFLGEWDKAERHLDLLAMQHDKNAAGIQTCRNFISAERARGAVLRGERLPEFMTTEPAYLSRCFAFRECLMTGRTDEVSSLCAEIEELLPEVTGSANGVPFNGFCDTDALLFPFLEVFIHDRYLWIPFSSLRELAVPQPEKLMDLLWTPARLVTVDGLTSNCYLPVLYPESFTHENEVVRMGKMTDWRDVCGGYYRGFGQHVYQVGEEERSLLDLREVTFETFSHG